MAFAMVLTGVAVGAGIGQLTGGNTKSTLRGAAIGGAAGFGAAALGFGAAGAGAAEAGATTTAAGGAAAEGAAAFGTAGFQAPAWGAAAGGTGAGAGAGAATWSLGKTLMNPMLLGSTGLGLISAFTSQGTSMQTKVNLKPEGEALMYGQGNNTNTAVKDQGGLVGYTRDKFNAASRGDTPLKAAQDIMNLRMSEGERHRASTGAINTMASTIGNKRDGQIGLPETGSLSKLALAGAGERMRGLFAPTSVLGSYKREELVNAAMGIANIQNLENQTASVNYQGNLGSWIANNALSGQRSAAVGGAFQNVGGFALNDAYLTRMQNAPSKYPSPQIASS